MCGSMVDIQSAAAEIRRGIKKEDRRKKLQGKNIMSASATQGGHNEPANLAVIGQYSVVDWYMPCTIVAAVSGGRRHRSWSSGRQD